MAISTFPAASTGGTPLSQKVVRITSTQTWNCPADVTAVEVIAVSGGGGGGGHDGSTNSIVGGGGGGGGLVRTFLTVVPSTAYTITIGAGGAGGGSGTDGAKGGTSSFGALLTVEGGAYGQRLNVTPALAGMGACGGGGASSGNPALAGHGGGMGSFPLGPGTTSAWPNFDAWQLGSIGFPGGSAFSGNTRMAGGIGIDGLCGGGMGGYALPSTSSGPTAVPEQRNSGAGWGAMTTSNVSQAAGAGAANTGGGGGGSARNNSFTQNGAAGGSGLMVISYWSAL